MILTKLTGYTKFNYVDKETKEVTPKVQVCFEDTATVPECGKIYSTYSFKQSNCPDFTKDSIGKEIIVELGNIQGRKYGSSIIFK